MTREAELTPEAEQRSRIEKWLAPKRNCRFLPPTVPQHADRQFLDAFDTPWIGGDGYFCQQNLLDAVLLPGHMQASPIRRINLEDQQSGLIVMTESPGATLTPPPDVAGQLRIRVLQARQSLSELQNRELQTQLNALAALICVREKTVESVAEQIGVSESLSAILDMTNHVFGVKPNVSVGDLHDFALVVSVNIGADADVDQAIEREREWYERLLAISQEADGSVHLLVNYE